MLVSPGIQINHDPKMVFTITPTNDGSFWISLLYKWSKIDTPVSLTMSYNAFTTQKSITNLLIADSSECL